MPDDCCCTKYPDQFHYHYTLDSVLKRNNKTCELCDIYILRVIIFIIKEIVVEEFV